jgi:hypothetical protein
MSLSPSLLVAGLGLGALLSGCTPPPPPTTSIADRTCVAAPDFAAATALGLPARQMRVTLDGTAPCVEANGARSVYTVFRLPEAEGEYLLSLTSAPIGEGLFYPRVTILGANGNTLREISRDAFVFRGNTLSLGLRMRPEEEYLLVMSDPDTTGQSISRIEEEVTATTYAVGAVVYSGASTTANYTYAYNGVITVSTSEAP